MILKIKELNTQALILKIDAGVYYIEIQESKVKQTPDKIFSYSETETLETYDANDYSVKEVVVKLDEIYELLKWDFKG